MPNSIIKDKMSKFFKYPKMSQRYDGRTFNFHYLLFLDPKVVSSSLHILGFFWWSDHFHILTGKQDFGLLFSTGEPDMGAPFNSVFVFDC